MKVKTSIDPKLIAMLGRKLYTSEPVPILVRELLQNSWDACKRKGVDPKITITLNRTANGCIVTCTDNGIGMTDAEIVSDFLCLGGTGKDKLSETGGFGIAKAAIMSHDHWSVRSLDNLVGSNDLYEGNDIHKVKRLEGTIVTVMVENVKYWYSTMDYVARMIYLSDVTIKFVHKRDGQIKFSDSKAGLPSSIIKRKLESTEHWRVWGVDKFKISSYNGNEEDIEGINVYRLNGLVQYTDGGYSDRTTNLFFEITPRCRPQDPDYPMTISREGIQGSCSTGIANLISAHDVNVLQSQVIMTRKYEPGKIELVRVRPGYFLKGGRVAQHDVQTQKERQRTSMGSSTDMTKFVNDGEYIEPNDPRAGKIALLMKYYESSSETLVRDVAVMRVWEQLINLCASNDELFGIGITLRSTVEAERVVMQNNIYYVINPTCIDNIESVHGKVLFLWGMACHECTHYYVGIHNEKFSTMMGTIAGETADAVAQHMTELITLMGSTP